MQEQPSQVLRAAPGGAGPVDRVSGDRVPDRIEMHPDLVGPPGDEVELQQGPPGESFADPVPGGRSPPVRDHGHPGPVLRVAPDRRLDAPDRRRHVPGDERLVGLADPPRLELGHQGVLRGIVLRDHEEPARVPVQPVDDPGTRDPRDAPVFRTTRARQQRVDHRVAVVVTGGRVDHDPGRLVHDQQVRIFVHDRERYVVGRSEIQGDRFRNVETDLRAGGHDHVRPQRDALGGHPPIGDQLLDMAAREARHVGHVAVDPPDPAIRHPDGADAGRDRRVRHRPGPLARRVAGERRWVAARTGRAGTRSRAAGGSPARWRCPRR